MKTVAARLLLSCLVLLSFRSPAAAQHGTVTFRSSYSRDVLPTDTFAASLRWSHQVTPATFLDVDYEGRRIEQQPFAGLPTFSLTPQRLQAALTRGFRQNFVKLRFGASGNRLPGGWKPGYLLSAETTLPLPSAGRTASTYVTLRVGHERNWILSSPAAIDAGLREDKTEGQIAIRIRDRSSVVAAVSRRRYSDLNTLTSAYAYGLLRVAAKPDVRVGYSYSWNDSAHDNWRLTASRFDQLAALFRYEYFYYPYFTPLREQGHVALALVRIPFATHASITGRISYPVYSRSLLHFYPESGSAAVPAATPVAPSRPTASRVPVQPSVGPEPAAATLFEVHDRTPSEYQVFVELPAGPRLVVVLDVTHFVKPYYSFTSLSAVLIVRY
jgi:hypothetical protein